MYLVFPFVVYFHDAGESIVEKLATVTWDAPTIVTSLWGVRYALRGYLLTRYLGGGLDGCRSGATSLDVLRHVVCSDRSMRNALYWGLLYLQLTLDDLGHGTPLRCIIISAGRDL
jgi:hypothetical protein